MDIHFPRQPQWGCNSIAQFFWVHSLDDHVVLHCEMAGHAFIRSVTLQYVDTESLRLFWSLQTSSRRHRPQCWALVITTCHAAGSPNRYWDPMSSKVLLSSLSFSVLWLVAHVSCCFQLSKPQLHFQNLVISEISHWIIQYVTLWHWPCSLCS